MPGMDKIPTQDEYENMIDGDVDINKIIKLGELKNLHMKIWFCQSLLVPL